jgi:hypothetical protein
MNALFRTEAKRRFAGAQPVKRTDGMTSAQALCACEVKAIVR